MKKAVILPLVAAISGALVGCGGSGGGGGSSTPTTPFKFKFAVKQQTGVDGTNCGVYQRDSDGVATLNYRWAQDSEVKSLVIGYVSDKDGVMVGSPIIPTSNLLSFNLEQLLIEEEKGYFTIQQIDGLGRNLRATTFSYDYLADKSLASATFGLQGLEDGSCIQADSYTTTSLENLDYLDAQGGSDYTFISNLEQIQTTNSRLINQSLAAFTGEPSIIVKRVGSEFSGFGINSWLGDPIDTLEADTPQEISSSTDYSYSEIDLGLSTGGFQYPVISYDNSKSSFMMPSQQGSDEAWFGNVQLDDINAWNIDYGQAIELGDDLNIDPDSLVQLSTLPSNAPVISTVNTVNHIEVGVSLDGDENGYQRIAYFTTAGALNEYSLTHKLYSLPSETVVIPALYYDNTYIDTELLPESTDKFNRTLYIQERDTGSTQVTASAFMGQFGHGDEWQPDLDVDIDGLVLTEMQLDSNAIAFTKEHYVLTQRVD